MLMARLLTARPIAMLLLSGSIVSWRDPSVLLEVGGEVAGVNETAFIRDLGCGEFGFVQHGHGAEDSGLDEKLLWAQPKGSLKAALELTQGLPAGLFGSMTSPLNRLQMPLEPSSAVQHITLSQIAKP
jgi:hypothetical protein